MQTIKYYLYIILISLLTGSCSTKNTTGEAENPVDAHAHESATTTTLTSEQIKSIGVTTGGFEKKQLTASLKANGILKVPNQNRANATSLLGGTVKEILVQTGASVQKGQTIAIISNNQFISMQEEYLSISARAGLAEADFERQKTLKEGNAASLKAFQQAEAELKSLRAKKSGLQKQLSLIGIDAQQLTPENIQSSVNIKSPINGSVSNVLVNIGSYLEASNPVAEIVDNSQLHLDLYVYEKDLNKVKVGQTIHFTLTNNPGKEYDADIYAISNTFEPNTKAVSVHATVKGDKHGLIDGMSITALISLENATYLAVPTEAIVSNEGQDFIFIVSDKEVPPQEVAAHDHSAHDHAAHDHSAEPVTESGTVFERIPIRKGTTDVGYSEITLLKDIPADSKVVTKGAFFILAKMTNQGEAHEH